MDENVEMVEISDDGRIVRIVRTALEVNDFWRAGGARVACVRNPDLKAQTIDGFPVADIVAKNGLPAKRSLIEEFA